MATYKVPQDVEAEDKLVGPFSFRQFIYLMIVAGAIFIAWGLAQLFVGLAVIPVPIIIFFGALALPLKKDQPMEVYLAALVSFYLKPRTRLWDPEGVESPITISAPKVEEEVRTKTLSGQETEKRFSYLANIVDSGGWAIRGAALEPDSPMISDVYYDTQRTEDLLDSNNRVYQSFDQLIDQSTERKKEQTLAMVQNLTQQPQNTQTAGNLQESPQISHFMEQPQPINRPVIPPKPAMPSAYTPSTAEINPYQPVPENIPPSKPEISEQTVSPDIINLANNSDLTVETISREANRIKKKSEDEVFISLR